jgi:tetratricopeptide (TPR) repeat protein
MSEHVDPIIEQARQDRRHGRLREALTGYERAAALARAANDSDRLAHAQRHVADLQRTLGQYGAAERTASEAVTLLRQGDGPPSLDLANALRVLALAQESLEQWSAAAHSWREAKSLYHAVDVLPGVRECDQHLADLRRA